MIVLPQLQAQTLFFEARVTNVSSDDGYNGIAPQKLHKNTQTSEPKQ